SGGNQQKVVLAKWLARKPRLLIVDEPTRGIDVGTKAEVHRLLSELAAQGVAVLMISSELPEVLGMADRIIVLFEGRLIREFKRGEADEDAIMRAATGIVEEAACDALCRRARALLVRASSPPAGNACNRVRCDRDGRRTAASLRGVAQAVPPPC